MRRAPIVVQGTFKNSKYGGRAHLETLDSQTGIWNLEWVPDEWDGKEVLVTVVLVKGKRA